MKKVMIGMALCLFVGLQSIEAQSFTVAVNAGNPLVFQTKTGTRTPVAAAAGMAMGDSLILAAGNQVTIGLETNSRLIFRGPGTLAITGDSSAAYVSFDQGQVFLDRMEPITYSVLTFWVKNYMFVPVGTAASIKILTAGTPAVAVIEGKVLMQSPAGESVEIPTGSFGTVDGTGRIASGTLGKKTVTALEKWSGVRAAGISPDLKAASSLDMIDQEFTAIPVDLQAAASAPQAQSQQTSSARGGKQLPKQAPTPVPATVAASAAQPPQSEPAAASGAQPADTGKKEEAAAATPSGSPAFELSAGAVTVNNQQWTRLALGVDVPIWKFGVFFDIEAFLDAQGNFSNKGWDFKNDPLESVTRKIRYIRFGHEQDPVFVKIGGISDVTFGYGFIVDRFTNMLHYPDQKLLGVQFYLNNVSPVGITLQIMGSDLQELRTRDEGGFGAARLAIRPFKTLGYPIIGNLAIGGTYAYDRNTYAPARNWKTTENEQWVQDFQNAGLLNQVDTILRKHGINTNDVLNQITAENAAKTQKVPFGIYGADLGLPLISSQLLSLDLYAQSGIRADTVQGWGIGAPGVALKVWRLSASLEYRHTEGRFVPGFFGPYYLDERLVREPTIHTKVDSLRNDTLNGVFGRLGFDIANVLVVEGTYQYLTGSTDADKDQRFELRGNIGPLILNKIPKIKKLEAYIYKTNIGSDIVKYDSTGAPLVVNGKFTYDKFFESTPDLYYGYRLGFEISPGATLICDTRFGYTRDDKGKLIANNNICVQTAFNF